MKKTYAAPTIVANGDVVRDTRSVNPSGPEGILHDETGRIGYDL